MVGGGLPRTSQSAQSVVMSEEAEQLLRETIENVLAVMAYRAPETPDTEASDRAYAHAAGSILVALQAEGWRTDPEDNAALDLLDYSLSHGLMAYRYKPPRERDPAGLRQYHRAVAASVMAQLTRSGWSIQPRTLRKAPPASRTGHRADGTGRPALRKAIGATCGDV